MNMTQRFFSEKNCDSKNRNFFYESRIEPFFFWKKQHYKKKLKILIFQKYDSQNCNFSKLWLTELNFWVWLKELNLFENITHRTELFFRDSKELNSFFFEYDSKNWTFFWFNSKNWTLFYLTKYNSENWICFYMTQRIEFFHYDSQNWTSFFFEKDSQNWTLFFFWIRLAELNLFSLNMTKELDSYFLNMTQGIEPLISWIWRK